MILTNRLQRMKELYKNYSMRLVMTFLTLLFAHTLTAQNQVTWQFQANKKGELQYEVVMRATIQSGWHLYSQQQPEDAIAIPTTIEIKNNPLVIREKSIREVGKMQKYTDKTLGVTAYQYSNEVSFVQTVNLKAKVKTAITGEIEYQVCDDEKCLPPKKVPFTIALN